MLLYFLIDTVVYLKQMRGAGKGLGPSIWPCSLQWNFCCLLKHVVCSELALTQGDFRRLHEKPWCQLGQKQASPLSLQDPELRWCWQLSRKTLWLLTMKKNFSWWLFFLPSLVPGCLVVQWPTEDVLLDGFLSLCFVLESWYPQRCPPCIVCSSHL